ncbi:hypothetical protein ACQWF7_25580, partial [Salmonella enterica subsp. enterica serovar Infantis]
RSAAGKIPGIAAIKLSKHLSYLVEIFWVLICLPRAASREWLAFCGVVVDDVIVDIWAWVLRESGAGDCWG